MCPLSSAREEDVSVFVPLPAASQPQKNQSPKLISPSAVFFPTSTTVTLALLESRQTQHDVGTDQCVNDYPPYSGDPLRPFRQMMKTVALLTRILSFCVGPRSVGPMRGTWTH